MMARKPILLIHGGAGSRKPTGKKRGQIEESLGRIISRPYEVLKQGGSAKEAVILAVELLENDDLYNAGRGSKIQSDGKIRMSASYMDGALQKFSGCVNVQDLKNPIRLAEHLQNFEYRNLAEDGALKYAQSKGMIFESPYTERAQKFFERQKKQKFGTVGAVAIDSEGRLAVATSTGGRGNEFPHRVSDTPTVAGSYANKVCAVSATGVGEQIVDFAVAARICCLVESGIPLNKVAAHLLKLARSKAAEFGFIAVTKKGEALAVTTTPHLIWAKADRNGVEIHP